MYQMLTISIIFIILFLVNGIDQEKVEQFDMTLKILGGQPVKWSDWNFMVYLSIEVIVTNFYGIKQCSATVLNNRWLLSAAHCFDYDLPNESIEYIKRKMKIYVISGRKTVRHGEKSDLNAKPFCHYDYSHGSVLNDICVLRLTKTLDLTKQISAVNLPEVKQKEIKPGEICKTAGWGGKIEHTMSLNTTAELREAFQKLEHNEICEEIFHKIFKTNYTTELHMCSALANPLTRGDDKYGPYKGDSGGPLICHGKQYGIISFGPSKDFLTILPRGFLGVTYTRVDHYLDWINRTMVEQNKKDLRSSSVKTKSFSMLIILLLLYNIIPN